MAEIKKYRKKPIVVEAVQFRELARVHRKHGMSIEYNDSEIADFIGRRIRTRFVPEKGNPHGRAVIEIKTLEGVMQAEVGDYIIKEPFPTEDRQFYPCKPELFEQTYEPLTKGATP